VLGGYSLGLHVWECKGGWIIEEILNEGQRRNLKNVLGILKNVFVVQGETTSFFFHLNPLRNFLGLK